MLLATREGVRYLICSCFLNGLPSLEDFLFAKTWVLPSCTFFPFLWMLCFIDDSQVFIKGRFLIKIKNRPTLVYSQHMGNGPSTITLDDMCTLPDMRPIKSTFLCTDNVSLCQLFHRLLALTSNLQADLNK